MTLLDVSEAVNIILNKFKPVEKQRVTLFHAVNRVLADDIYSPLDIPPFDNSAMDGFAVKTEDIAKASEAKPVSLKVSMDIPAGSFPPQELTAGCAARVMTGGPVPKGSDAVVPVEHTDFNFRQPGIPLPERVEVHKAQKKGANIRLKGEDLKQGSLALTKGKKLRPQEVGLLSMLGVPEVVVYRQPRVAVFSTGDELVPVGQPLPEGKIHDANLQMLIALIEKYGGEPVNMGLYPDDKAAIRNCLESAVLKKVDLIVSSAGVSVGTFDFVKSVLEEEGEITFWKVNMRPGKPLAFGSFHHIPLLGLPGNPVSAFVGFETFIRPAIQRLSGLRYSKRITIPVVLKEKVASDGRETYLRAIVQKVNGKYEAELSGHQGSGNLFSLTAANALLKLPSGVKSLPEGAQVEAILLD